MVKPHPLAIQSALIVALGYAKRAFLFFRDEYRQSTEGKIMIIYDGKIRENKGTRPSAHTRTASEESLTAWCLEDLLPLIHIRYKS